MLAGTGTCNRGVQMRTGWSSDIPQFNPLDILDNIRRLMADQLPETMTPWYRGYVGSIKRIGPNRWMTKGRYRVIDEATIEIFELPVGLATQDFKEMLDMFENGYKSALAIANATNAKGKKKTATPATDKDKDKKQKIEI